jgi:hypothetical protein
MSRPMADGDQPALACTLGVTVQHETVALHLASKTAATSTEKPANKPDRADSPRR